MPIRIIYLDDEPDLLDLFSEMFSSPEVLIETFSDPARAIEAIRSNPPDLLFLDHRLPRTTGDRVALEVDPTIPKALVTGDVNIRHEAKFDAVFEKPFPIAKVREFILAQVVPGRS